MYIRYCDSCRKELKDSDHFWECKDYSRPPYISKLHICAKCMGKVLVVEKKKESAR